MSKRNLSRLAKDLGCTAQGLDPIPPDQYLWMQGDGEPPLYRLWSWMVYQTMHWGRDSAFAISADGHELYLKHAANDLGIDEHNIYKYWQEGLNRGLWRNGTRAEGTQRLYLSGTVPRKKGEDTANTIICTYNFPPHMMSLSPRILEQIKALTPEKQKEAFVRYGRIVEVGKRVHAELIAAGRMVIGQDEDTLWRELGVEKNRHENGKKEATPEELQARQQRIAGILPEVHKFVQIIDEVVQVEFQTDPELYKSLYTSPIANASLLTPDKSQKGSEIRSRQHSVDVSHPVKQDPSPKKGRSSYTRPEQPIAPAEPRKLDEETQHALKRLAELIEHAQHSFKHTDFGLAEFDPISKPGQLFLLRLLDAIGGAPKLDTFWLKVVSNFKGLDRNAMGKAPARAPGTPHGPRGIGLILEWASDFGGRRATGAGGD